MGTEPETSLPLHRLPVRPEGGQGQTHSRDKLADFKCKDKETTVRADLSILAFDVPDMAVNSNRKASLNWSTPYEADTVALEKQLEGTRIVRKGDPSTKVPPHSL